MQSTQILVFVMAAFFAIIGFLKMKVHFSKLMLIFPWVRDFKPVTIRFLGFVELLAGGLLVLPFILEKAFAITSWTALFLAVLMILASMYHSRKKDYRWMFFNLVLMISNLVIAFFYKQF